MRLVNSVALVAALFSSSIQTVAAENLISISLNRRSAMVNVDSNANRVIVVRVVPHVDNQGVFLACDSGYMYSSSAKELRLSDNQIPFPWNLASGNYICEARLFRKVDGKTQIFAVARKEFSIF